MVPHRFAGDEVTKPAHTECAGERGTSMVTGKNAILRLMLAKSSYSKRLLL